MVNFKDWFDDGDYYTGPPLTDEMVQNAEKELGYKLPKSYIELLRVKNGGSPALICFPTKEPTGWAPDHVEVMCVYGIGGKNGIDAELGSSYLIGA